MYRTYCVRWGSHVPPIYTLPTCIKIINIIMTTAFTILFYLFSFRAHLSDTIIITILSDRGRKTNSTCGTRDAMCCIILQSTRIVWHNCLPIPSAPFYILYLHIVIHIMGRAHRPPIIALQKYDIILCAVICGMRIFLFVHIVICCNTADDLYMLLSRKHVTALDSKKSSTVILIF